MPETMPPFDRRPDTWPWTRSHTSFTTGSKMSLTCSAVMTKKPESSPASSSSGRPGKLEREISNIQNKRFSGVYIRNVDFLVLILVKVSFNKLLKVSKTHLPRLSLLTLHLVKACLTKTASNMFFKAIVQKGTSTQPSCSNCRLFDSEWLERDNLVRNQTENC